MGWGPQRKRSKGEIPCIDTDGPQPTDITFQTLIQDDAGVTWQMWRLIPVALGA